MFTARLLIIFSGGKICPPELSIIFDTIVENDIGTISFTLMHDRPDLDLGPLPALLFLAPAGQLLSAKCSIDSAFNKLGR